MKQINSFPTHLLTSFFLVLVIISCKKPQTKEQEVVPITPSELTATLVSNTQATLNWVDKSTNETGFKVERKTGNGTFGVIATTNADITTINDAGLTPNTTYTYRVYSFNNTGKSLSYTNEVTITTISLATITTTAISDTTGVSAVSGGNITSDGGSAITARGVVWGTSPAPTVSLTTKTTDGSGTGQFSSRMEGLSKSTKYYVRAYATNAAGTAYGNELSFTTLEVDLVTGLLAYYPFNGNANDESGNQLNGIVNGAVLTNDRKGNPNRAYSFSANSDIVTAATSISPQNFTISLWCKVGSPWVYTTFNMFKLGPNNPSTFGGFSLRYDQNDQIHGLGKYKVYGAISSSSTFLTNLTPSYDYQYISQWHHFVFTRNNNTCNLYVDNVLASSVVHPNLSIDFTNAVIQIGNQQNLNNNQSGKREIDDIRLYNRSLSAAEISYLFNN